MLKHMGLCIWPEAVSREDPRRMADRLHAAHIDILIPYISRRASTMGDFGSPDAYEQRLHAIIREAHRQGLLVYGCFDEMNAYPTLPPSVYSLMQVRQDGSQAGVLCPANPEVVEYILSDLSRILTDFQYDGIVLEDGYIFNRNTIYDPAHDTASKFKTIPVCYCNYCKGHAPIERPEWNVWKQEQLTRLVEAESRLIRRLKPGLPFSCGARLPYDRSFYQPYRREIPYYDDWEFCQSRDSLSADWVAWLKRKHLDFTCPMSYFHSTRLVEIEVQECLQLCPDAAQTVWMALGLGDATAEYGFGQQPNADPSMRNNAAKLDEQLNLLKRMGLASCIFFAYEYLLDEHIPVLAGHRAG